MGVGGGIVASPVLLTIGAHPSVVTASTSFMILFTSTSTTLQFAILGRLPWDYALFYGALCFVSSLTGNYLVAAMMRKYKKSSYVILLMVKQTSCPLLLLFTCCLLLSLLFPFALCLFLSLSIGCVCVCWWFVYGGARFC